MTDNTANSSLHSFESAKQKAFVYLSHRRHSSKEICEKLRCTYCEKTALEVVKYLEQNNYLCDEEYASARAKHLVSKNKSAQEIQHDLMAKGVGRDIVQRVLNTLKQEEYSEHDACIKIIEKSYMRKICGEEFEKVIAALMRRGFSYNTVKKAVQEISEQLIEEE